MSRKKKQQEAPPPPPRSELLHEFDSHHSADDLGLNGTQVDDALNVRVRLIYVYDESRRPVDGAQWVGEFHYEALGRDRLGHPTWHEIECLSPSALSQYSDSSMRAKAARYASLFANTIVSILKRPPYVEEEKA